MIIMQTKVGLSRPYGASQNQRMSFSVLLRRTISSLPSLYSYSNMKSVDETPNYVLGYSTFYLWKKKEREERTESRQKYDGGSWRANNCLTGLHWSAPELLERVLAMPVLATAVLGAINNLLTAARASISSSSQHFCTFLCRCDPGMVVQ